MYYLLIIIQVIAMNWYISKIVFWDHCREQTNSAV